jgi:hypothetical protein
VDADGDYHGHADAHADGDADTHADVRAGLLRVYCGRGSVFLYRQRGQLPRSELPDASIWVFLRSKHMREWLFRPLAHGIAHDNAYAHTHRHADRDGYSHPNRYPDDHADDHADPAAVDAAESGITSVGVLA